MMSTDRAAAICVLGCLVAFGLAACGDTTTVIEHTPGTPTGDTATAKDPGSDSEQPAGDPGQPPKDEGPGFGVACPAELSAHAETEPNDHWSKSTEIGTVSSPGFCVQGTVLCGNDGKDGYANPGDHYAFTFAKAATAQFQLEWKTDADLDFLFAEDFDKELLISFETGKNVKEKGQAQVKAGATYYLSVNCWEGTPGDYALWVTW